jgi:hypothetical protein
MNGSVATVIGCCLVNMVMGASYIIGTMGPFLNSYFRKE